MPTIHKQDARPEPEGYSYEDVERWMYAHYNGECAWVTEKGADVIEKTNAKHIKLQMMDGENSTRVLHANTVNKYLIDKKKLWIDFDHAFVMGDE